ncbi:MAG: SIS domain-containing protein [Candidatus Neomarinimicrobiota bacterium]
MAPDTADARTLAASHLEGATATLEATLAQCLDDVLAAGELLIEALRGGHTVYLCGNGGSAADAQHLAAELMGRFMAERGPLPAVALTTDTSLLTAWSNDVDFATVFARQVEGLGRPGDLLVAITTSGDSANVVQAVQQARKQEMPVIVLTGQSGGRLAGSTRPGEVLIRVPSTDTQHIQEGHLAIGHVLCALAERSLVPGTE